VESTPTVKNIERQGAVDRKCCAIAHRKTACNQNGSGRKGFSRPVSWMSKVSQVCSLSATRRRSSANGRPVPGVAQAAIQQGRYVGRLIARQLKGRETKEPFRYFVEGNMAVVGKNFRGAWKRQWFWSYLTGQRGSCLIPEVLTAGTHEPERQVTSSAHD
jgi:hypothetical protein